MNAEARLPGRSLEAMLRKLAAKFGDRFDFGTQRTSDGISLTAVRREPDEPGLYAVITDDPDEMRDALREDEDSPPGSRGEPPGGG